MSSLQSVISAVAIRVMTAQAAIWTAIAVDELKVPNSQAAIRGAEAVHGPVSSPSSVKHITRVRRFTGY
jgi:hypothetical protein